jgi:hypothetical protein
MTPASLRHFHQAWNRWAMKLTGTGARPARQQTCLGNAEAAVRQNDLCTSLLNSKKTAKIVGFAIQPVETETRNGLKERPCLLAPSLCDRS